MVPFRIVLAAAQERAGGRKALQAALPEPKSAEALAAISDDRYLSLMSLRIFRAGLKHDMVDAKWPAFEQAFLGFDPRRVRAMSDERMERLLTDQRLIRHWGKLKSVRDNAAAMCAVADEESGFGRYLGRWPAEQILQLWEDIARRFSQMGGNSAPNFLRMAGKDSFILTPFVSRALVQWQALAAEPKSKGDRAKAADAILAWSREGRRPLCQVSMILARSVE